MIKLDLKMRDHYRLVIDSNHLSLNFCKTGTKIIL